jgi:hypothetical protein
MATANQNTTAPEAPVVEDDRSIRGDDRPLTPPRISSRIIILPLVKHKLDCGLRYLGISNLFLVVRGKENGRGQLGKNAESFGR